MNRIPRLIALSLGATVGIVLAAGPAAASDSSAACPWCDDLKEQIVDQGEAIIDQGEELVDQGEELIDEYTPDVDVSDPLDTDLSDLDPFAASTGTDDGEGPASIVDVGQALPSMPEVDLPELDMPEIDLPEVDTSASGLSDQPAVISDLGSPPIDGAIEYIDGVLVKVDPSKPFWEGDDEMVWVDYDGPKEVVSVSHLNTISKNRNAECAENLSHIVVRYTGSKYAVTARLVDVVSGKRVWTSDRLRPGYYDDEDVYLRSKTAEVSLELLVAGLKTGEQMRPYKQRMRMACGETVTLRVKDRG